MDPLRLFAESLSMKEDPISHNLIDIESSPENILIQNQHHLIPENTIIPPPMQTDLQQFPHLIPFNQETQFTQQFILIIYCFYSCTEWIKSPRKLSLKLILYKILKPSFNLLSLGVAFNSVINN